MIRLDFLDLISRYVPSASAKSAGLDFIKRRRGKTRPLNRHHGLFLWAVSPQHRFACRTGQLRTFEHFVGFDLPIA